MAYKGKFKNWDYFGDEYGGVEITYFPVDPFSALYCFELAADHIMNNKNSIAAMNAINVFESEARKNFKNSTLTSQTGTLENSFFGKITSDGRIVFGNRAISKTSGEPYATHLEYGFMHYSSGPIVGPYNFMRPAIEKTIESYKHDVGEEVMVNAAKLKAGITLSKAIDKSIKANRYTKRIDPITKKPYDRFQTSYGTPRYGYRSTFK